MGLVILFSNKYSAAKMRLGWVNHFLSQAHSPPHSQVHAVFVQILLSSIKNHQMVINTVQREILWLAECHVKNNSIHTLHNFYLGRSLLHSGVSRIYNTQV